MMTEKTNFAFFGTPSLAVEILDELAAAGYTPSLIVTVPDRPQGRGMDMHESAVATWARVHSIELAKPEKLDAGFVEDFARRGIAFSIVVAYGKILPQALLDISPMYNIHYSLLPRLRGATPVESPILAGETETGVAIQRIVYKLDAGPLVGLEKTEIGADETAPELRLRLNGIAKKLLISLMPAIAGGSPALSEQNEAEASNCGKISKEDGHISLTDDGVLNYRKYRAYFGWPGVYTYFERPGRAGGNKQIRTIIARAHMENKKFVVDAVKPEGKGEIAYADFLRSGAKPTT